MDDQVGKHDDEAADEAARKRPPEHEPADYEDPVDDAAADSFPASDPPSFTDSSATRNPDER